MKQSSFISNPGAKKLEVSSDKPPEDTKGVKMRNKPSKYNVIIWVFWFFGTLYLHVTSAGIFNTGFLCFFCHKTLLCVFFGTPY